MYGPRKNAYGAPNRGIAAARKEKRREDAVRRQADRDERTPDEQWQMLGERVGVSGAARERGRLRAQGCALT